jgi:hypothetical protein
MTIKYYENENVDGVDDENLDCDDDDRMLERFY